MEEEVWKPIAGFEGRYDVSNLGRVRSWVKMGCKGGRLDTPLIRNASVDEHGRHSVSLTVNKKVTVRRVHQLVMEAFVGPRPDDMVTCHNNGDPGDNRLTNLRYDTPASNSADMKRHGTAMFGSKNPSASLTESDVRDIKKSLADGVRQADIARMFNISRATASRIANGKAWAHVVVA